MDERLNGNGTQGRALLWIPAFAGMTSGRVKWPSHWPTTATRNSQSAPAAPHSFSRFVFFAHITVAQAAVRRRSTTPSRRRYGAAVA